MELLRLRRLPRCAASLAVALSLLVAGGPRALAQPSENDVKAAFLYNFTRFVDWPDEAFLAPDAPFLFCILGEERFGAEVVETVAGKALEGRATRVRHLTDLSGLSGCHLLFVGSSERGRLPEILAALRHLPVLTVGDTDDFVGAGGMIGFVLRQSRVRFEIDQSVAERAGLSISSRLLDLAERVVPSERSRGRR